MRILMLTDGMDSGGAETHLLELASGLVKRGHRVCVVSSGGALVSELTRRGVFHIKLPMNKTRSVFLIKRLCRIVRIGGFEVIHSHSRISSFIANAVAKRTGVCFVTTAHARFSLAGLRRRLSRWGSRSIAVSEDLKQYLTENYAIPPECVTVIPNGVDSSRFYPDLKKRGERIRIAFLSRLDDDCSVGAFLLCNIAKRLVEEYGRIEIVIGGGGSALERIREHAAAINSELGFDCVRAVGRVCDVPAFLQRADVFVGVSRAAIEASFCSSSVLICGDEGFLGALDRDNFALGSFSNFCARGLFTPTAEALYCEIASILGKEEQSRIDSAFEVRELMLRSCELNGAIERTERFYRRALYRPSEKRAEVVLCGYYGFGNMGDDALLRASVERARTEFPRARISAVTQKGAIDSARLGIRCVARKDFLSVMREIRGAQHFIFGGGTLLQDSTSRRSLAYYSALLGFAKRSGARCYLWGNGIGEPRDKKSERILISALSCCEYIGLRDRRSFSMAKGLLKNCGKIQLEPDLAQAQSEIFKVSDARLQFLLGNIELNKGFIIIALKGKRCCASLDALMRSATEEGRTLVFAVMFEAQDLRISRRYCKKYGGILKVGIDFADLVGLVRHSLGVYSMRLHALVAAKLAGVSFQGFGDNKVTDFE